MYVCECVSCVFVSPIPSFPLSHTYSNTSTHAHRSQVSGSQYAEDDDEDEDESEVQLPLPPMVAHTTTRAVAGVGPMMGTSQYSPGHLHRLALHGKTDEVVCECVA